MHFSIPDSVEVRGSESTYLIYNLYVNGNFHCSLRYRQFLGLHEQIRREVGTGKLPSFPGKKFLSLTSNQLEERRCSLEKYIQTASQNQQVAKSELFTGFLRLAQHETSSEPVAKRSLDVYLPNGHQMTVDVWNNAATSVLLGIVAEELKLREDFTDYFGLYIHRKEPDGTWIVIRRLEEYESPCISIKWLSDEHRIVLRKCAWDLTVDNLIVEDAVGLFLIYVQTVADIENGWIVVPREVLKQLTSFQSKGNKKDYVTTARRLKYYGYMKFPYCHIESLQLMNEITVYIGNKEVIVVTPRREEIVYKISRMKCFRITLLHEIGGGIKAEMCFEYLQSKEKLEWITIASQQAVMMALCLKEIVADFVANQHPKNPSLIGVRSVRSMFYYIRRDGETVPLNEDIILGKPFTTCSNNGSRSTASGSSGNSSPTISTNGHTSSNPDTPTTSLSRNGSSDFPSTTTTNTSIITYSKRRPSSTSLRHQNSIINSNDNLFLENSAFAGIGDDDL